MVSSCTVPSQPSQQRPLHPPTYEQATSREEIHLQWDVYESSLGRRSQFRPQSRRTLIDFGPIHSTALPPVLPSQDEEVVDALLEEFEQSIDEAERASELVRVRGERIMAMKQLYEDAGRYDLAELMEPIAEIGECAFVYPCLG